MMKKYNVILADPPWKYDDNLGTELIVLKWVVTINITKEWN